MGVTCVHPAFIRTPIHERTQAAGLQLEGFSREEPLEGVVAKLVAACEGDGRPRRRGHARRARCSSRSPATCPALVDRVVARTLRKRVAAGELDDAPIAAGAARSGTGGRDGGARARSRQIALPAALAVIMCALGLSLTPGDFKRVLVVPKGVAIGLANLLVISPAPRLRRRRALRLDAELAVGLVLMAAAPGGTMAERC